MKDKKTLWGRIHIDSYQHVILRNGVNNDVDLTRLLAFDHDNSFVNITIEERLDGSLDNAETNTINDI